MSIDRLQERIRRTKNPSVIDITIDRRIVPDVIMEQAETWENGYLQYMQQLLEALRGQVPSVRLRFNSFALYGAKGHALLTRISKIAHKLGFYILMDAPDTTDPEQAEQMAHFLLESDCDFVYDSLIISSYMGSDGVKPYVKKLEKSGKSLFVVVRTANKSASELQDLLTGSRLVHTAMADVVNHIALPADGKSGYSQVAYVAAATSADSLRLLRSKYKNMFLLVDGYDYPSANAKNCSFAFDSLGHGAIVCAGVSVCGAWRNENSRKEEYVAAAVEAVERMRKNLSKYITIL